VITKTAIEKSGIVSLTRSNPFAFSYAIGGEVAAAVLPKKRNRNNGEGRACHRDRSYHFVVAVWRAKEAQSPREVLGNNR